MESKKGGEGIRGGGGWEEDGRRVGGGWEESEKDTDYLERQSEEGGGRREEGGGRREEGGGGRGEEGGVARGKEDCPKSERRCTLSIFIIKAK